MSQDLTGFSSTAPFGPADFPDANEVSLSQYSFSEETSYSSAINNAITKHLNEIKDKQDQSITVQNAWKKRIREFLVTKSSKLLEFLTCKLKNHPVLSSTENFFQKFSKTNIKYNQSLRDIVLDISSNNISEEMDALCISNDYLTLPRYIEQTKFIMEQYKLVSEKILDKENLLKIKLSSLDSLQNKIVGIQSISHNEHYEELMSASEKYIGKIFEENNIEKDYNEIIENYRKFLYLREVIKTIRLPELTEKEPLCSICFSEQIQYAFVPCGHTYCSNCTKKQFTSCSICRSSISDRIKIFFT
jgi:hypothetical protein